MASPVLGFGDWNSLVSSLPFPLFGEFSCR